MNNKESFFKNHADTVAIIGVNIAIAAILVTILVSNISSISAVNSRIDVANARSDQLYIMFYDLLKEVNK